MPTPTSFPSGPVVAAILAAGSGARMDESTPKQLLELADKPLLAHSLRAFEDSPQIDEVVIVGHGAHLDAVEAVAINEGIGKLTAVATGGERRSDSSLAAIDSVAHHREGFLLIHDAARPLVDQATISAVVAALVDHDAAAPALPVSDTIAEVSGSAITAVPPRRRLRRLQTPQGFKLAVLRKAYELAALDPEFESTDDCGVVHRYLPEVAITLVNGSERNIKITYPEDLALAARLVGTG